MSAVEIREAAALMRERAEALNGERWAAYGPWLTAVTEGCNCNGGTPEAGGAHESYCGSEPLVQIGDEPAAHIAGMQPAVALAVADWLDVIANGEGLDLTYHADEAHALRVARTYLGSAS